ncbi:hypothetical protein Slin15195_G053630 [Septoria linicola]|uniref:Uncharacterized protein n=1 Tax=Septoria linicola TaxID=215465 RepID=A0A9Q9APG9_9PEZI|nr:hypothetical protein Slin15195_G053630 [Septoria linicola]
MPPRAQKNAAKNGRDCSQGGPGHIDPLAHQNNIKEKLEQLFQMDVQQFQGDGNYGSWIDGIIAALDNPNYQVALQAHEEEFNSPLEGHTPVPKLKDLKKNLKAAKKTFRDVRDDFLLLEHKTANSGKRQEEQAVDPRSIHNRSSLTATERPPNSHGTGLPDPSHVPNDTAAEHYDDMRENPIPAPMQVVVTQEREASLGQPPVAAQHRSEIPATTRPSSLAYAAPGGVKRPHGLIYQDVVPESVSEPANIQRPSPGAVKRRKQQNPIALGQPQQSQHVKVESMPAQSPLQAPTTSTVVQPLEGRADGQTQFQGIDTAHPAARQALQRPSLDRPANEPARSQALAQSPPPAGPYRPPAAISSSQASSSETSTDEQVARRDYIRKQVVMQHVAPGDVLAELANLVPSTVGKSLTWRRVLGWANPNGSSCPPGVRAKIQSSFHQWCSNFSGNIDHDVQVRFNQELNQEQTRSQRSRSFAPYQQQQNERQPTQQPAQPRV